jgi:hypothetical protein|tara:strand:+ start:509 stop:814 length:306 start_codon:yes stop_codon:yes gene_type:complete
MSDKAEDNIKYGTKKYFKQFFNEYSDIVKEGLDKGLDMDQTDINVMSRQYKNMVDAGADDIDIKEAKDRMKSIVKEYMKNKKIESQGKDAFTEKKKMYKDV